MIDTQKSWNEWNMNIIGSLIFIDFQMENNGGHKNEYSNIRSKVDLTKSNIITFCENNFLEIKETDKKQ